ncbi:MAG: type II toxin-antitoxin system RelE/ParE family toxin [Nitrospirae bacterium]|nr:type II toxin-antitoxin system RelE/ParE family toxin [Nitrospirota bacterium]
MTYTLRFLPEVEEDVINGYFWYESKSRGLGEDFLRMFYAYANEILWNLLHYPKVYQNFRRRLLRRFPYAIYFEIENDQIIVFGLFHCARNPQAINAELENREK